MSDRTFEPEKALGSALASMDRQELCRFMIALCGAVREREGEAGYCGGLFPENISRDESGEIAVGPAALSDWGEEELRFVAPELYWDGKCSPASDVYSLGLLLWYGLSGGKLPLEGESPDAQLSRMSGKSFPAPAGAGIRLGEIVQKACAFKAEDRYAGPDELGIVLESCLDEKYETGAELFKKKETELSEAERMMLAIIGGEPTTEPAAPAETETEAETDDGTAPEAETETQAPLSREEAEELILAEHVPEKTEERDLEAEKKALVEEVFGEPEKPAEPETPAPADEAETPAHTPEEDVRVYKPGKAQKNHVPIPILTEEKNPELAPVIPTKRPAIQYSKNEERNRQITESVKKRRTRPVGVVLILCGLLIIAALVVNALLQNYEWEDEGRGRDITMPEVGEKAIGTENGFISGEELERQQREAEAAARQTFYQVLAGDISWTKAKNACTDQGGRLAVIHNNDEFTMVTQLAQQSGMKGVWVGCHREGGFLIWETTDPVGNMTWANNEPSYTDSRDGAAEDYIMLWNTGNGWAYIDCRNDPTVSDPGTYSGQIGYVCEFSN